MALHRRGDPKPNKKQLATAAAEVIYNEEGEPVTLWSVLNARNNIVVFIRHFRCGLCQDFLVYLTKSDKLKPWVLAETNAKVVVIGCGNAAFIKPYRELLDLPFEVYANPSGTLYQTLGFKFQKGLNTALRSFYFHGTFATTLKVSILRALRLGKITANAGDAQQLGGELVLTERGRRCKYAHYMRHTADHAPCENLLHYVNMDYSDSADELSFHSAVSDALDPHSPEFIKA